MAQAEIFLAHISEDRERMQTVKEHLLGTACLASSLSQPHPALYSTKNWL